MRILRFLKALVVGAVKVATGIAVLMALGCGGMYGGVWVLGWLAILCGLPIPPGQEGSPEMAAGSLILILLGALTIVCVVGHGIYTGVRYTWEETK